MMGNGSGGGGRSGRKGGGGGGTRAPSESEIMDRFHTRADQNLKGVKGTFSNQQYSEKEARDRAFMRWYRESGAANVQIKNEGDRERLQRNVERWTKKGY